MRGAGICARATALSVADLFADSRELVMMHVFYLPVVAWRHHHRVYTNTVYVVFIPPVALMKRPKDPVKTTSGSRTLEAEGR